MIMAKTKNFLEMSDDEITRAFTQLAHRCDRFEKPEEEFKRRVVEEFDCPYTVAISFSKALLGMRMHMGMVFSPNSENTINF